MTNLAALKDRYREIQQQGLNLSMTRGQPANENFDLANDLLTMVTGDDTVTPGGIEIRNYPGGVAGLPEARACFASFLGVRPEEMIVGDNSSLMLMSQTLTWALVQGLRHSRGPWIQEQPRMIVTIPGYDRHFALLEGLGYELVAVPMTPDGPDIEKVEAIAGSDPAVKGIFFVPVYSNPTGDTISDDVVRRLVSMPAAAPDFTIFADNAYAVHHLTEEKIEPLNLLRAAEAAGNPDRVILYGSTSKITFAGGGIGFMGTSRANVDYFSRWFGLQTIGPNKIEQYRHVRFFQSYPGGVDGLMKDHAAILRPKFAAVQEILTRELGGTGLATWTNPKGGYFVSLDTAYPVADRVVALAKGAGVALTPAGATFPGGRDPENRNIRLSPSRPPVAEVARAMEVVSLCIQIASAEAAG